MRSTQQLSQFTRRSQGATDFYHEGHEGHEVVKEPI